MKRREVRTAPVREVRSMKVTELRAEKTEDGKQYLSGYAATFNTMSEDLGYFNSMYERILPGAFTRALQEKQDVRHLKNHDPNLVLGRTKAGTLELSEDSKGLKFRTLLPDTSYARDLVESVNRGDIDECSFGFCAVRTNWIEQPDPADPSGKRMCDIRELCDVDLFDVSTVTYPAYPATSASMERSLFPEGVPAEIRSRLLTRAKGKAKTKRVAGEDLTSDCFIIVGDKNDTSTWKLPWKFSTEEKTQSHLRNALARFSQLTGVSDEEKAKAYKKLVRLCKEHDIEVSDEEAKSWQNYTQRASDSAAEDDDTALIDCLENVSADASDFAMCAAAALSEVSNNDEADAPAALADAVAEAKELMGLLQEFLAEAEDEESEEEQETENGGEEETNSRRRRLQLAIAEN